MTTGAGNVLRKKLSRIQSHGYNFPIQHQLAAKVEYAVARGATAALGVTVAAVVEDSRVTRLGSLIDTLPMPGLFVVMRAGSGDQALTGLDMRLVDHVVEIFSGGDPNNAESLPTRKPTTLDGALCRPAIATVLEQLYAELESLGGDAPVERFETVRTEHIPTDLSYLLSEQQYLSFRVNLEIGDNARTGYFYLVLPLSWIEPIEAVLRRTAVAPANSDSTLWRRHMRETVRQIPLKLTAVIESFPMHVAEMAHLQPGSLLPLSGTSLDDLKLELDLGGERRIVARGRLGIHKRNKAIRIVEPMESLFFEALARKLSED